MRTLYRRFIVATILILVVSTLIGFALANVVYVTVSKEKIAAGNLVIAESIVNQLEQLHDDEAVYSAYLSGIGELGYQVYLVSGVGEEHYYGEAFDHTELDQVIIDRVHSGEVYTGNDRILGKLWMMNHLSNKLENTIGVPVQIGSQTFALFLKQSNQLLFSDFHAVLVGFILATVIVSIIGVFLVTKQLIRPISQLTEATKAISHDNYNYELKIDRKDEIGQLAESFHSMQLQLKHNDEARKAFISDVSHDFQSPLLNIQGYAELLQNPDISEVDRSSYSQIIDAEARRLSILTKQLLLITSLDQESYPLKLEKIRLDLQLKDIIHKYQWRAHEQSIEISYKLEEVSLLTDNELLSTVWENLLSNAIKYNRENGFIHISCVELDSHIRVAFEDGGIGIPESAMPQLFERFFRVDESRKWGGTGLGLAIVQQVVELLEGEIRVASELGSGSKFEVLFRA
jgi:signal transduction histidine kinase